MSFSRCWRRSSGMSVAMSVGPNEEIVARRSSNACSTGTDSTGGGVVMVTVVGGRLVGGRVADGADEWAAGVGVGAAEVAGGVSPGAAGCVVTADAEGPA